MLSLVEPGELAEVKRSGRFTLQEIVDVVAQLTGVKVDATSLCRFINGGRVLKLEAWKAVSTWYIFFMETAPYREDYDGTSWLDGGRDDLRE